MVTIDNDANNVLMMVAHINEIVTQVVGDIFVFAGNYIMRKMSTKTIFRRKKIVDNRSVEKKKKNKKKKKKNKITFELNYRRGKVKNKDRTDFFSLNYDYERNNIIIIKLQSRGRCFSYVHNGRRYRLISSKRFSSNLLSLRKLRPSLSVSDSSYANGFVVYSKRIACLYTLSDIFHSNSRPTLLRNAFRRKKALHDSHVNALKLYPIEIKIVNQIKDSVVNK
ncbi:hypothetical protein BLOT_012481 [Blomia tropicalis]|nr:hypothetical protein BLOT_012481 [Blomia tropicalis]